MAKADTSVDERGFRRFDRDGHAIAWFAPKRLPAGYAFGGDNNLIGQCTEGDWWRQQGGKLTGGLPPLRGGSLGFEFRFAVLDRTSDELGWIRVDETTCAGSHYRRYGLGTSEQGRDFPHGDKGLRRAPREWESDARRDILIENLRNEGWRIWAEPITRGRSVLRTEAFELRVWCPECVAEWQAHMTEHARLKRLADAATSR